MVQLLSYGLPIIRFSEFKAPKFEKLIFEIAVQPMGQLFGRAMRLQIKLSIYSLYIKQKLNQLNVFGTLVINYLMIFRGKVSTLR